MQLDHESRRKIIAEKIVTAGTASAKEITGSKDFALPRFSKDLSTG